MKQNPVLRESKNKKKEVSKRIKKGAMESSSKWEKEDVTGER